MSKSIQWDRSWLKELAKNPKLKLFPIQIANIYRIENNDAVYIFDEVGSGKSISSGLIARHFIQNIECNDDNYIDCLVITVNANILPANETSDPSDPYYGMGSFEKKLKKYINLYDNKVINNRNIKVKFINNDYRNIAKYIGKKIGLLIIDEVHTFAGFDTKRKENLCSLEASKIIIMTATPFKQYNGFNSGSGVSYEELMLIDIVQKITRNPDYNVEFPSIFENKNDRFISNSFDLNCPVTRYFKDTIASLGDKGIIKPKMKRLMTEIIDSGDNCGISHKAKLIAKKIFAIRMNQDKNEEPYRFIIFTRYKKGEQDIVRDELIKCEFREYTDAMFKIKASQINYMTYRIVNGDTKDISEFTKKRKISDDESMPDILVITSQIADQGIDLPSYSHIVNLYIPANPASLEQRFGRIDRLDKDDNPLYKEITMWYVVSKVTNDKYSNNLIEALYIYMSNLLVLNYPSKNILFDKDKKLVTEYNNNTERRKNYFYEIQQKLNSLNEDNANNFFEIYENRNLYDYFGKIDESLYYTFNDLIDYVDFHCGSLKEKDMRIKHKVDNPKYFLEICKKFIDVNIEKIDKDIIDMNVVNDIIANSEDIFYIDKEKGFKNYNSWEKCAKVIANDENYIKFVQELDLIIN